MNTGHGSKSQNAHEFHPFAAEVYRAAEPAPRGAELEDLRAEMRNEVRSLRAHLAKANGTGEIGREIAAIRAALEGLAPVLPPAKRSDRIANFLRVRGIEGPAASRLERRRPRSPTSRRSSAPRSPTSWRSRPGTLRSPAVASSRWSDRQAWARPRPSRSSPPPRG